MSERTAEEAKQNYVTVMGEPLGLLFHSLWQEVAWLFQKWHEHVELFGTKESRVNLLNEAAPAFFRVVQDTLWDDTLLHVARLTDPPRSAGRANLTIQRLSPLIGDDAAAQRVRILTEKAVDATTFCRDWRNRRIAHRDLGLVLDPHPSPLAPASREQVRLALTAIVDVLNAVSSHYMDTTSAFDILWNRGGAVSLLHVLDDGVRAGRERLDRLKRGDFRDDDVRSRDL